MDKFIYITIGTLVFWATVLYILSQKNKYLDLNTIGVGFFAGLVWPITLFVVTGRIIWEIWQEKKE